VVISVFLALAASVTWGVSDFLGGLTSRQLAVGTVLLFSQVVGFLVLLPIAALHAPPQLDQLSVVYAIGGSLAGLVGVAAMYRGMVIGTISIVAPISATGAAVPVLFGLLRGERASLAQSLGIALALVGIVLASRTPTDSATSSSGAARGVGFGLLAALGFGGFFVLLHEASTRDVLWASVIQRLTGAIVAVAFAAIARPPLAVGWPRVPRLVLIGALDAGANVLYALSSTLGLVSLAAVLASLFPVVTVLLARVVLHERLVRLQAFGVVSALAGVVCIALP
jgi:drug/metabolite transporter (DMT)-like permease